MERMYITAMHPVTHDVHTWWTWWTWWKHMVCAHDVHAHVLHMTAPGVKYLSWRLLFCVPKPQEDICMLLQYQEI